MIRLTIRQEAPECRVVGRKWVRGERGANRVRFTGRLRGKTLPPGTYTIRADAVRRDGTRPLGEVTIVIVPPGQRLATARPARSTCVSYVADVPVVDGASGADGSPLGPDSDGVASRDGKEVAGATAQEARGVARRRPLDDRTSIVGSLLNPFREAPVSLHPILLAMLAAAAILFALGVLPARVLPSTGPGAVIARRQGDLLLAGAGLVGAVVIAALAL